MSNIVAGRYVGRATGSLDMGFSTNGNEQFAAQIELLNEGVEGVKVTARGVFASPKSTEIALRQLRDLGWSNDDIFNPEGLGSVEVDVVIDYETYEGKERMKVSVWPLGGGVSAGKPLDDNGRKSFAARMKGAILQSRPKAPTGRPGAAGGYAPRTSAAPRAAAPATQWDGTGPDPDAGGDDAFPG